MRPAPPRPKPAREGGGTARTPRAGCSCSLQPAQTRGDQALHATDLGFEVAPAARSDLVGPAAVVAVEGGDHAVRLEARYRAVERARAEAHAGDGGDVLDHGV